MKILIASLFLPEEKAYHAGGRFVFEMIRALSHRQHEIHLATRFEASESAGLKALDSFCREIYSFPYRSPNRRTPAALAGLVYNYLRFSNFVYRLIKSTKPDVVMVEWVETAIRIRKTKTPMILDAHDVITKPAERTLRHSNGLRRFPALCRFFLTRAMERRITRRFDVTLTRSTVDRDFLLTMNPGLCVRVVPHPAGLDISTGKDFTPRQNTMLFLASYKHRRVNVDAALWFYREVFPLVRRQIPDARFIIAGYGPPEELTSLAAKDPQVEVPGFIDDINRCYKEAMVFVAPILTGGGIIVKILDALAAAVPVVTTSYGNEGINATPGKELLIGDDSVSMAAGVVRIMRDKNFADSLGANGKAFVQANFSLDSVVQKLEETFRELVPVFSNQMRHSGTKIS